MAMFFHHKSIIRCSPQVYDQPSLRFLTTLAESEMGSIPWSGPQNQNVVGYSHNYSAVSFPQVTDVSYRVESWVIVLLLSSGRVQSTSHHER